MSIAEQRSVFSLRTAVAVPRADSDAPTSERERNRYLWHFLAWSFIVGEGLGLDAFRAGKARAADDDADEAGAARNAGVDKMAISDGTPAEHVSGDADDGSAGAAPENQAPLGRQDAAVEVPAGDGGYVAKAPASGAVYNAGPAQAIDAGGGGGGGGFAGFGVTTTVPIDPSFPILPLYASDLTFFDGLGSFAEVLGFSSDPFSIAAEIGGTASGPVMAALSFAQHPLTAVPVWQSLGGIEGDVEIGAGDGMTFDWVVQASGITGNGQSQFTSTHGIDGGVYAQTTADSEPGLGNEAVIVDGGDWDGTLWVTGNYYEFNTIIQVNVLWDRDTIEVERGGSNAETPVVGSISSGNNVQSNTAEILEAEDLNPRDQLIIGGSEQHFSAVQLNAIIDVDNIEFELEDVLSGIDLPSQIDGFGDVNSAGHDQSNASLMMAGDDFEIHRIAPERFFARHQDQIQLVNGNFYEFNTIVQVNVVNDADEIHSYVDGRLNEARDVIASGGNIQFNRASIFSNDNDDSLFVGGRYTQYNLALQINSIDDSDRISQLSNRQIGHGSGNDHDGHPGSHHGDDGDDGADGPSLPEINITMPSVIEDMMVRGHDALA
ncbi:MAG: hypothetical protein AB1749_05005 [Pseudomonadota bacterium]